VNAILSGISVFLNRRDYLTRIDDDDESSQVLWRADMRSSVRNTMKGALPTLLKRLSKSKSKLSNGFIRLVFALVLLAVTAVSVHRSMVFPVDVTQHVTSLAFENGVPDLSPPQKVSETTKKSEERVKVTHLSPPKSDITKTLAEKVKVSKPSPPEKEAGNSIESESEGKQGKDAASASIVANTKSDDSVNAVRGAIPVSAPVPATSTTTSNLSPNPNRVYWCGYTTMFGDLDFNLAKVLFPDVPAEKFTMSKEMEGEPGPNDVLIRTRSGRCWTGKGNPNIEDVFPGKIMYVVGESKALGDLKHERVYSLGPLADSKKTLRAYFGAMVLGMAKSQTQQKMFDPQFRVKNTKKKFLYYLVSRCFAHREQTFTNLSSVATVYYGGGCSGLPGGNGTIEKARSSGSWIQNAKGAFKNYRFGLVMENKKSDGYITEKIVNAFLSGTVPIWYGTSEIFDVINERAFVFYDVEDPQPAMDRIIYLENNQTAYDEVLNEPILANGNQTIEEYFSFRDDVGGGKLKKRIRNMLGYQ
jgi:hypothetical protein